MEKKLSDSVRYLKGVGPKKAEIFSAAGINTIEDLLYYFPRRYEDRANFTSIKNLKEGEFATVKVEVLAKGGRQSWRRSRFSILELAVGDHTGRAACVWFNQPYLKDYFQVGVKLILYGKVERYGDRLQFSSPEFEIVGDETNESLNIGRIVPVYSLPKGLTQRVFRKFIKGTLDEYLPRVSDFLPFNVRSKNNFFNLAKSLLEIHFPQNQELQKEAHRRLSFEEFFIFQILLILRKNQKKTKAGIAHKVDGELVKKFIAQLPFDLTFSQEQVIKEISQDMQSKEPMQRLLQGDVGSGKTVVATIAGLMAIQSGYQVAFMAPTEILAKQHFEKIGQQKEIKAGLLTSSIKKEEKDKIFRRIYDGEINFVIGTHALLEENVRFKKLGLVVIDEQHKFGVGQRALLSQKGESPDVLIMTATPIPRTLAITIYGDLDISVISELPPGRLPIKTLYFSQEEKSLGYAIAKEQLKKSRQVFIVYPVIEDSYALDIAGAKKMYEVLKKSEFKDFRVGLIHGRLKQEEQNKIMLKFKNKEIDLLVSTTVLEVGIDIPNATCMIIEHTQRFGLSQLHQLRGRVGRGPDQSFCVLISDAQTEEAKARIEAMVKYGDGFHIADEDLKIRGPGEFFGRRQSGLSELKIANPLTQMQLLKKSREEAIELVNNDPLFSSRQNSGLKEKLLQRFPEYEKLMLVG